MFKCSRVRSVGGRFASPLIILFLVAGCQSGGIKSGEHAGVRHLTLSSEQVEAVHGGVKQIVSQPETAQFTKPTAISAVGEPGIHVCGYVKVAAGGLSKGDDLPYYLELRQRGGKPVPERGQVGYDTAKRSKVSFMCRRHGTQ